MDPAELPYWPALASSTTITAERAMGRSGGRDTISTLRTEFALGVSEVRMKTRQKGLPLGSAGLGSVRTLCLEVGGKGLFPKSILSFYSPVL